MSTHASAIFGFGTIRGPISACLIYVAAAHAQAQVLLLALDPEIPLWQPALIHGFCVALLFGWFLILRKHKMDGPALALLLISTMTLGPIGYFGTVLSIVIRQIFGRVFPSTLDEYYMSLSGETQQDIASELYRDLILGRERPGQRMINTTIVDVLRWGTPDEKYKVMTTLARSFRPELAPALRFALSSTDATIRIQAAALVAKIERDFTQRWVTLRSQIDLNPHQSERYFALAQHLDEYAYIGILDPLRERSIRREATELFREYIALDDGNNEVRLFLGRLLTRRGEFSDAITCLLPVLHDERARSWYYQSLYGLGRFDQLRHVLQGQNLAAAEELVPTKITRVRQLWSAMTRAPLLLSSSARPSS